MLCNLKSPTNFLLKTNFLFSSNKSRQTQPNLTSPNLTKPKLT